MDEDNVLRLYVSMDDSFGVEVAEGFEQGPIHKGYGLFFEPFLLFKDLEELSVGAQLHEGVDVGLICEDGVEFDHVFVVDEGLYL